MSDSNPVNQEVEQFNKQKLKKTNTQEKNHLPTKEGGSVRQQKCALNMSVSCSSFTCHLYSSFVVGSTPPLTIFFLKGNCRYCKTVYLKDHTHLLWATVGGKRERFSSKEGEILIINCTVFKKPLFSSGVTRSCRKKENESVSECSSFPSWGREDPCCLAQSFLIWTQPRLLWGETGGTVGARWPFMSFKGFFFNVDFAT